MLNHYPSSKSPEDKTIHKKSREDENIKLLSPENETILKTESANWKHSQNRDQKMKLISKQSPQNETNLKTESSLRMKLIS